MKTTRSTAAILLLASAGLAANHGVEALSGDRFTADISPAGDADPYVIPLAAGARLGVEVQVPPGSTLQPTLTLRGPDGASVPTGLLLRGEGTSRLSLRNFPVPATGVWAVVVGGAGGSTGAYGISVGVRSPSRFPRRGVGIPGGGTASLPFAGRDGAALSFLVHRRSAAGSRVPLSFSLRDPSGAEAAVPPEQVLEHGSKYSARAIRLSGPPGEWFLRVYATDDAGIDAFLRVRYPRPRNLRAALGPEPRPESLDPVFGRGGLPFTVTGEAFAPGARVRFGESWTGETLVEGGTTITGAVPHGPESLEGLEVEVFVAGPDGQENRVPGSFRYIGVPRPDSVTPAFQPPEGGLPLVISGRNFRPGFSVAIGGIPRPEAVLSPLGEILCTSPPHALGAAPVAVTDEFGRTGTLERGVTYIGNPSPSSVSPASSSFTGGRTITLAGTNLRPGLAVSVDGVPCEGVTYLDTTHLRFRMPAGPAGTFDLAVADEFGRSGIGAGLVRRRGPFVDASAASVPAAAGNADFFGHFAVLGDLDGDKVPDLLVGSPYPIYDLESRSYRPPVKILLNDGAGAFTNATGTRLGPFARSFDLGAAAMGLVGDLDGDGVNDLVLADRYPESNLAYSFARNGKTYAYATKGYYGGIYPDQVTYGATRILLRGKGEVFKDGTAGRLPAFGSTPFLGLGERWQAEAGALGDLDGDGDLDLVLAAPGAVVRGTVSSSVYSGGVTYLMQSYSYLASTRILRNDGHGSFSKRPGDIPAITFMNGTYSKRAAEEFDASAVALGDLDGDGDLDLVLVRAYPNSIYHLDARSGTYRTYYAPATRILANNGTGRFTLKAGAMPATFGSLNPGSYEYWQGTSAALGDLDGDGDLDLVVGRPQTSYWYDGTVGAYRLQPALRIFTNDGTGKFTEATASFLGTTPPVILDARSVALGDLDGDGKLDLVVTGQTYYVYAYPGADYGPLGLLPAGERAATRVLINDGTGRLEDLTSRWMPAPVNGDLFQADAALLGDLDGDGRLDLVLVSDSSPNSPGTAQGPDNRPLRILKCR